MAVPGVRGDFGKLAELRKRFLQLADAGFRRQANQTVGGVALKQIADEFRDSRDPYGVAWKPPVLRPGGRPLQDTGRLKASPYSRVAGDALYVVIPVSYARVHQEGAVVTPVRARALRAQLRNGRVVFMRRAVIPRRRLVPSARDGGFGPIWGRAINGALTNLIKRRLGAAA